MDMRAAQNAPISFIFSIEVALQSWSLRPGPPFPPPSCNKKKKGEAEGKKTVDFPPPPPEQFYLQAAAEEEEEEMLASVSIRGVFVLSFEEKEKKARAVNQANKSRETGALKRKKK